MDQREKDTHTQNTQAERERTLQVQEENNEKSKYRHVFLLIEKQNLFNVVSNKIVNLIRLSRPLSAKLLIQHIDKLPARHIAAQLIKTGDRRLLHWYVASYV